MRLIKYIKYILFVLLFSGKVKSQQLPHYSQYMMNRFLINPAMAGAEGYTSFNLTAREQWLGLENAPRTQALSGQTRLLRNSYIMRSSSIRKKRKRNSRNGRVGVGGYLFNDMNGVIRRTGMEGTYAYHINTRTSQMSFGLAISAFQYKIDEQKLILYEINDPLMNATKKSSFVPDANFGFYWVNQKLDIGFSALQLFQSTLKFGKSAEAAQEKLYRHYYLNAGFRYSPKRDYIIEPSTLIAVTKKSFQMDIGARLLYQQSYWGGLNYRTGGGGSYGDLIIQGGVKVNQFLFGYAFDYTLSGIQSYTLGSHEIMMAIKIGDNARRYRWLNRY